MRYMQTCTQQITTSMLHKASAAYAVTKCNTAKSWYSSGLSPCITMHLSLYSMPLRVLGRRGVLQVHASEGGRGAEHPADTFLDMHGWGKVLLLQHHLHEMPEIRDKHVCNPSASHGICSRVCMLHGDA